MPKRRVSLRLADDEVAVVAPVERWEHLIMVYEAFAREAEDVDREAWNASADWIREWIARAVPRNQVEEDW